MAKADDFTKYMTEMMQSFPMDSAAMQDAFKSQAALGEKMSKVALDAAGKSSELGKMVGDTVVWEPAVQERLASA